MPRKSFESEFLYGMHDPGGEHIMRNAGRKGWILFTEEIGHDPSHRGGTNYRPWSDQGFGVMVRLNNGYYPRGTIPYGDRYESFGQRCANFVAGSVGAHIWIIGNEMNFAIERPQDRQGGQPPSFSISPPPEEDLSLLVRLWRTLVRWIRSRWGREDSSLTARLSRSQYTLAPGRANIAFDAQTRGEVITPELYARCYSLCRDAIHNVPGHEDDLVLTGAVAPWNPNTGDWVQYFRDILARLGPDGCDGITLHTYTHGYDLRLITEDQFMDPPFDRYRFNFRCYIDFMEAIPANMRHLPVYVTEADEDEPWLDEDNVTWIQRAYDEIDRWNQEPGRQQIRSMVLYRWPRVGGNDKWWIVGKGNVIEDFRRAMVKGHKWNPDVAPIPVEPSKFEIGQQVFVAMTVNIRRTPGWRNKPEGDVLGHLTLRTTATIQDGPAQKDSLTWWAVSSTLSDGTPVEGWVADALTDGRELLSAEMPPLPVVPKDDTFGAGAAVTIVSPDPVNVRSTPGYRNKPPEDVVAEVPPNSALTIVQGPTRADDLVWWQVSGTTSEGTDIDGWVAEAAPNGVRLLAPTTVAQEIEVGKPFQGQVRLTQGWGSNPAFYSQFTYDGVPLRGHNGLDFGTPMRTPLVAVDGGSVKRTGFDPGGFGNFVLLQHEWGESLYAHMEQVHVERNQTVSPAQVIGLSGNTGASTGPHLHFGIRITPYRRTDGWGGFANPIPFMDAASFVSFGPVEDHEPTPFSEETLENPRP
jgi:murein DD-endopeptidase MepM/ murein hydrolase activator NlpD